MLSNTASPRFAPALFLLLGALAACSSATEPTGTQTPPPDTTTPPTDGTKDGEEPKPPTATAYSEAEVQALFDERCTHCHGKSNDILDLTSFAKSTIDVSTGGPTKTAGRCDASAHRTRIVRGNREASLLWHKVKGTQDCGSPMPYDRGNKKLDATELERLGLYIDGLK
jgi:hypothetical protein